MHIGTWSSPSARRKRPIHIVDEDDAENVEIGAVVGRWQWTMEVDGDFVRPSALEKLRRIGDPKADAVVRRLKIGKGVDALQAITTYLDTVPESAQDPDVRAFWEEVSCPPPASVAAHCPEQPVWTPEAAIRRNNRFPEPTLDEGQAVHWRYTMEISSALLHFSLAAGFSSQRLINTLQETGYLTSSNREVTYRRLLETHQMGLDVMRDLEPVKSQGWRSAVRVRLLHAQARVRILEGRGKVGAYDVDKDGIPLNQEDMAATLAGFCVAPIWACRRLKVGLTEREELAYLACWRHIGYYLGVNIELLERHFTRLGAAEAFLACSAWHLFGSDQIPPGTDPFGTMTMRVLEAISSRPPQASTLLYHVELARRTLGPGLSARLALPPTPLSVKLMAGYKLLSIRCFTTFGRYYRSGWNIERALFLKHTSILLVAWQLGNKRTKFVAKEISEKQNSVDDADFEHVDVLMGKAAGLEVRRRYKALVREMVAVLVGIGAATIAGLWWGWYTLREVAM